MSDELYHKLAKVLDTLPNIFCLGNIRRNYEQI